MHDLPNIDASTFTLSAVIVGFILIGDLNSTQQNSLGNWFMLVGQVLETSGSYVFNGQTNNTNNDNQNANNPNINQTIDMLTKTINAMQKELDELKKNSL